MSVLKKHLRFEEIAALSDGTMELLPEVVKHIEDCEECSRMIKNYESMRNFISANRSISHFPDLEKIELISERSFKLIHDDQEENILAAKTSFMEVLYSFLKPLAVTAGVALLALLIYTGIDNNRADENLSAGKTVEKTVEAEVEKSVSFAPALRKQGDIIKTERVAIKTLAATYIGIVSENEAVMKKGKAKFDVDNGDDFKVKVSDRFIVRVLGTSFVIESGEEKFSVEVVKGLVEVIDNSDNSVTPLAANMNKTYEVGGREPKMKTEKPVLRKTVKVSPGTTSSSKLTITPEASFLTQGREALTSGKKGAALQLFIMELERGDEKDKALFEITRIHANEGKNNEVLDILGSNSDILNSSKLYKEEFLIRGCHAQHRTGTDKKSFCDQYLKDFPRGYKYSEIKELVNGK